MKTTSVRDILKSYRLFPIKWRGQNFLDDPHAVAQIIEVSNLMPDDIVVEIGPGLGALTLSLAERVSKVIAIETDRNLTALLKKHIIREHPEYTDKIEVINDDALRFSYIELHKRFDKKLKLVANLPYNISTPILFKLLEERGVFTELTLMLQQEVAERITAPPGIKAYGILSVMVQLFADVSIEFNIPPSSFYPRPKVSSSIVRFKLLKRPRVAIDDLDLFRAIVKAAFGKRRKTLKNALRDIAVPDDLSPETLMNSLQRAGIDPMRRGETLSLEEFKSLHDAIKF
ncbi:MAG: 16S rRNA (adenine(1518)-N(6)/adenine(1519)-N(6))-dimethyltransferase RsmA [Thermodesulfobacteriota bacterium]